MSIKKIAEATGISPATVARALSGKGYCSDEKKAAISRAAQELNYRPNLSARTLRNNRTEKILMGIPDICNAFYFRMIEGVTAELDAHDYYPIIFNTRHQLDKELKLIDLLSQKYADGLILVSFDFTDRNIEAIRSSGLPVVLTNRYELIRATDNFDFVYSDHTLGMEMVTEHMIKSGARDILLLAGANTEQTSIERVQGYKNMLKKHGLPIRDDYILNGNFETGAAYQIFRQFMEDGKPFDAIITANELMFMGVMRLLSERHIDFGNVKLASFDNTDFSTNLAVTSLDLRQDEIGRIAVQLLMERIHEKRTVSKQIYLQPKLVVRS